MGILVIGGVILLTIGLAILSHIQARKRRKELAAWASARGFSFDPGEDGSVDGRYPGFSCLERGDDRYGYNIMRGESGKLPFCAFDYHYETYSYDSKQRRQTHHHHFSAAIVEAGLPLKPLLIRGETIFDKVGEFLGFNDIDFESAEFSRRFCVKSPDRRWAFDVLHQGAMEFLLNSPRFDLEFQGRSVIAYRNGTFTLEDFGDALTVTRGLLDLLPESVKDELKGMESG
jgi:hypothetical protein